MSLGDFDTSAVVYFKFTTFRPSTGAPYTLAGTPVLSVYKDSSTTQTTTGVTLTVDFDSVTGLNHVAVDTSADGTFYSAGSFFDVVITTGTVDSVSAVGSVVGRFTLRKTSALKPTTAGRTLDADTSGKVVLSAVTHTGATIPTVTSVTNRVTANTDQWNTVSVTGMPMPTYTQPTGFLAATFPTTVASTTNITSASGVTLASSQTFSTTGSVGSVTAAVTVGTNNDKTGYSLTQAFPSNFAALGINSSGHVSRVTLVDTTTTNTDMRGTDSAALASVWTPTRAAYLDSVLIAANSNQRTVSVTGSQHIAADVHETQPGAIHATTFDAGAIDAAALAADAATEIATATLGATIEGSETLTQSVRLMRAALVGKLAGAATTTVTIRDAADSKDRITATVDADGNRTAVTTDAT